jgi:hypothetical protein
MVSGREFWRYAMGVRDARRRWALRVASASPGRGDEAAMIEAADRMRQALADGPKSVKALGELGAGFVGNLGLWVDLVRVPPSGTWERRRADILALAEAWVGPCDATEGEGLAHLVRAYLRAFGPAPWRDIASWAGIPVEDAKAGAATLALTDFRDEGGRPLVDLPGADLSGLPGDGLPDPETPAPVRFLPHWDASLLVHARRAGILPEAYRARVFHTKNPFSVGVYLVDGAAAAWSVRAGATAPASRRRRRTGVEEVSPRGVPRGISPGRVAPPRPPVRSCLPSTSAVHASAGRVMHRLPSPAGRSRDAPAERSACGRDHGVDPQGRIRLPARWHWRRARLHSC